MTNEVIAGKNNDSRILALFLDGTWNDTGDNTNVWRLKSMCLDRAESGRKQLTYYDRGVNGLWGGSFGKGLIDNVIQGYEWLVENYQKDDDIFIFGFSRGAYTARSLAGFVAKQGLLLRGSPLGVGQIYNRYKREGCDTIYKLWERASAEGVAKFSLEDRWTLKYSAPTPIKMLGVWDTVGAHGIPAFNVPGLSSSSLGFLHTGLRQSILNAYHAVAIDEHRKKFAQTLWTKYSTTQSVPRSIDSVEQRWFVGAHANVGGGYSTDPLSQPSLRWMCAKARKLGLALGADNELDDTNTANVADSYAEFLKGTYRYVSPRHHRKIFAGAIPTEQPGKMEEAINETIDGSVFDRVRADEKFRPPNLVDWAKRMNVDLAKLHGAVLASNPGAVVAD